MAYKSLTRDERAEELLGLIDLAIQRLKTELIEGKDFKAATIHAVLDLLNKCQIEPKQFIGRLDIAATETQKNASIDRLLKIAQTRESSESAPLPSAIALPFAG